MKKYLQLISVILSLVLFPLPSANAKDRVRIGGDVIVEEGTEVNEAVAVGGSVTVYGKVKRSAVAVGGSITLGPNAEVGKDVVAVGGPVEQAQGSEIHGDIVEMNIPAVSAIIPFLAEDTPSSWSWIVKIGSFLGFLALAVLLVAVVPKPFNLISDNVRQHTGKIVLWGLLGLIVVIPLAIFLVISVIGIPLIALEAFLVGIAFLVGYIAIAQLIGDRIAALMGRSALNAIWLTTMGLFALWVIGWIPFLGSLVKAAAIVLGFGGVLATLFTSKKRVQVESAL